MTEEIKYLMPALTDDHRENLVVECNRRIANAEVAIALNKMPREVVTVSRDLMQIALAALTAEPVYQFIVNNPDHDGYIEWADCNPDFYSKEPADKRRILYTAPPVVALKLPEVEKWRPVDQVRAQMAYRTLVESFNGVTK